MAKKIITISREFGSGGRFIGEEVAKKLGIAYYDKDIIGQIAEQSGLSPEYIKENAELSPKKGLFAYAFAGRDITGKSIEDMVYEAQRKVILELAGKEPCVIVGRNADYILKDRDDVLNVFIHGDMPEKVQHICKLYNVTETDAINMIKKNRGIEIDLDKIDVADKEVYKMIGEGKTTGVFQLESPGMTSFMKELKPDSLEDIIAGVSLYRPGPMDQIPRYINNKKG